MNVRCRLGGREIVDTFVDVSRQLSAVEAELKTVQDKLHQSHNQSCLPTCSGNSNWRNHRQVDEKVFCIEDFTIEKRRSDGKWIVTADDHKPYFGCLLLKSSSPFEALVATDASSVNGKASNGDERDMTLPKAPADPDSSS